ncbi:hypothetical protein EDB87DRAFT_1688555 [Lactarius vividus]|nr:hypothetical protein EDB87DRAFT_1688555 [Lactarius vividus]
MRRLFVPCLRPTNAIAIGDFFIPFSSPPHRVQRVGTFDDGGKWVYGLDGVVEQDKCVVYSFGINGESSFESTLLKRAPGCEWGPEITSDPKLRDRAHFKPFALGGTNDHDNHDNPKSWTLDSLMDLNGLRTHVHRHPRDRRRGAENLTHSQRSSAQHAAAEETCSPSAGYQLEIHAREGHENFEYFARWWAAQEAAGLRPCWTEPDLVYVNIIRGAWPELAEYQKTPPQPLLVDVQSVEWTWIG